MVLVGLQLGIYLCRIIQDLQLITCIGSIALHGSSDSQSIIGSGSEFELKAENKISILFCGIEVSPAFGRPDHNGSILHRVAVFIAGPVRKIFTIEQANKSISFFSTNETVLTALSASFSGMWGLHESTEALNAMKDGINQSIEVLSEIGGKVQKAALKAGYGPTIKASSVKMLVDSVVKYQEDTTQIIKEMRVASTRNAKEISESVNIPQPIVAKVLTIVSKHGLVLGTRGKNGGYLLARPPAEISVYDITSLFEKNTCNDDYCPMGPGWCEVKKECPLHGTLTELRKKAHNDLKELTLDAFIG